MANYQKLYTLLFNRLTDAVRQLDCDGDALRTAKALATLKQAQLDAEELFVSAEEA